MRKEIITEKAPAAIGPYSQANIAGKFCFTSGQIGLVPETGELREGIEAQTEQVLMNLKAVLEEAGSDMDHIVKTTCFLNDMADFAVVNEIYAKYFNKPYPSRSAVQVAGLPKGALIEIEAVAYLK